MGAKDIVEKVNDRFQDVIDTIKRRIFGVNNEHLDFVMDSFYKLNPTQRNAVLVGVIGSIIMFVFTAVGLYFTQINSLKRELNQTFAAMHELKTFRKDYKSSETRFESLVSVVSKKTGRLKMKPFFEKLSKQHQVIIEGLTEQKVALPADNPLSERLEQVMVELRMPKISIPRLLNFLVEIEKSNRYLRVQDLQIRGRYGTRLFFDGFIKVRGYSVKR